MPEVILEFETSSVREERTIAEIRNGMIVIRYEYRCNGDEHWTSWQDMGASFPVAELPALVAMVEKESKGDEYQNWCGKCSPRCEREVECPKCHEDYVTLSTHVCEESEKS